MTTLCTGTRNYNFKCTYIWTIRINALRKPLSDENLEIKPVNPGSPIPLYFQVENDLRRLIYEEKLKAGAAVPPEHELSKAYQVSRHTIRQALSRIEADDLISRGAGRGTIVKHRTNLTMLSVARSFTTEMETQGYTTRSKILDISAGVIGDSPLPALERYAGSPCLNLSRLRFADDEPVCLQYSTIITTECADLIKHDFEKESLYQVLSEHYKLYIKELHYSLSAQLADKLVAEHLDIEKDAPVLAVSTTAISNEGKVLEYAESYYRADKYQYSISHQLKPVKK